MAAVTGRSPEPARLSEEQAALRRVAALVGRGAPPAEVFAAVAQEANRVMSAAGIAVAGRYVSGPAIEVAGGWSKAGQAHWVGRQVSLGGRNVATLVFESSEPARVDMVADDAAVATVTGVRSSAGAPISVPSLPHPGRPGPEDPGPARARRGLAAALVWAWASR